MNHGHRPAPPPPADDVSQVVAYLIARGWREVQAGDDTGADAGDGAGDGARLLEYPNSFAGTEPSPRGANQGYLPLQCAVLGRGQRIIIELQTCGVAGGCPLHASTLITEPWTPPIRPTLEVYERAAREPVWRNAMAVCVAFGPCGAQPVPVTIARPTTTTTPTTSTAATTAATTAGITPRMDYRPGGDDERRA